MKALHRRLQRGLPRRGLPIDGCGPAAGLQQLGHRCAATAGRRALPGRGSVTVTILRARRQPRSGGRRGPAGRPLVPPMPQEIGWKDTVQALPNMVTRVLVRFAQDRSARRHARRRGRVRLQPERRPRLRLALPHRRPRGQRDDAAVQRDRRTRVPPRTFRNDQGGSTTGRTLLAHLRRGPPRGPLRSSCRPVRGVLLDAARTGRSCLSPPGRVRLGSLLQEPRACVCATS